MTFQFPERCIEGLIKAACIADSVADSALTPRYRTGWASEAGDTGEADSTREQVTFPLISIMAAPSTPTGPGLADYTVPVEIEIWTDATGRDPNAVRLASLYQQVREVLETSANNGLTDSDWCGIVLTINDGGARMSDNRYHLVTIPCTANMAAADT